ncbi:MAG: hypothetical protein Q9220_000620 [cf. Caloplaca sp. 1 TL-2023]
MSNILILGAGELGIPIIHSLHALSLRYPPSSRSTLTVLLRPSTLSSLSPSPPQSQLPNKLSSLSNLSIKYLAGDISTSTVADLAAHFKNFDVVVGCTGFSGGTGTQLKLAHAVLEAGVQHYYPWQFGVDYDIIGPDAAGGIFSEQCEVRELLRGQAKTKWTIVSTGMFTSFLFEPSFGVVDKEEAAKGHEGGGMVVVRALESWKNKVTVTTPEDIGKVVAELVISDLREGVVFTAGDTLTYGQVADLLEDKLGKGKVRRELWTLDYLQDELRKDPQNGIKRYRVIFAEGNGVSWEKSSTVDKELGIETKDVRSFLSSKYDLLT